MRALNLLALTAASLVLTTPALAASQAPVRAGAASSLSLVPPGARVGASKGRSSALGGEGNGGWIIGAIGLVAGVTYAFIQKADDDDEPASP